MNIIKSLTEMSCLYILTILQSVTYAFSVFEGGRITDDLTLHAWESPFSIKENIFVEKMATLTIEAGTELRFAPNVMLAVNGTVKARVSYLFEINCNIYNNYISKFYYKLRL